MDRLSTKGQMIDQIDLRNVPHSGFDRSNHNYGTGKLGTLIATRLDEVYPGDRIKGKPEMVVNFEPLAAPLMGSMVLKQESFFVPYIQLWRHAYKFFTGKNGFNEPMPTVSPYYIFGVYDEYVHSKVWSMIGSSDTTNLKGIARIVHNLSLFDDELALSATAKYSDVSASGETLFNDFKSIRQSIYTSLAAVYSSRKMFDLVQPALNLFDEFLKSEELETYSAKFESGAAQEKDILIFGSLLGGIVRQFFEYFHGPSSLFDYLGWPVPTDLNYYSEDGIKITIEDYGVYDVFQYMIYRNILQYGSANLLTYISTLFSQVPLVFNPFKAYYLVWYWNYRDQLLETAILDPEEDEFLGSTITDNVILYCTLNRQRCWFKDTYTTALTNTGDGNLLVPTLQPDFGTIDVSYYNSEGILLTNTKDQQQALAAGATVIEVSNNGISYRVPMNYLKGAVVPDEGDTGFSSDYISLDLFDRIKRLRSYVQKRLILGYEVDDVIWSSFMVRLSNVRMHIPEILGRGRDSVQINTVVNNTTTAQQIAGDKTATAWAHGQQSEMDYFSEEWGLFLTICTIMPIQSYAGGLQRLYLKKDPLDYAWPEFATMGMDAVYNTELAALGTRLTDEQGLMVFGYQGRYYDLKSRQDEEHGRLLTDLNYLTFSREWDKNNPPLLNYVFVHCWPRLDGFVIESPLIDVFRYDCYNAHAWERRLPVPSEIVG